MRACLGRDLPPVVQPEAGTWEKDDPFPKALQVLSLEMRTIVMAITGVAFTAYPVTDVSRAVAFYRDTLGLTKAGFESDFWVEFDVAGSTFGVGSFEQIGAPGSAQSFALEVSDLASLRSELIAKGCESTEPFETPVCFISVVRDPDGNQISYISRSRANAPPLRDRIVRRENQSCHKP